MKLRPVIIIPHFNNHGTIGQVVRKCTDHVRLPIIIVDDGSLPGLTIQDLLPSQPQRNSLQASNSDNISFVNLPRNCGKGAALRNGFQRAIEKGYTHAIVIDADGQHDPGDIPKLIAAMERHPFAIVSGVRNFEQASIPGRSKFGRRNSNFWVWYHTGYFMRDSQSGFRAYPLFGANTIECISNRYAFEVEFVVRWLWKFKVEPVDVNVSVSYSQDTISHFMKYRDNFRATYMHIRLALQTFLLPTWVLTRAWSLLRRNDGSPWTGRMRGGIIGNWLLKWMAKRVSRKRFEVILKIFIVPYFLCAAPTARSALNEFRNQLDRFQHMGTAKRRRFLRRWLDDYRHFLVFAATLVDRLYASMDRLGLPKIDDTEAENIIHLFENEFSGAIIVSAHMGSLNNLAQFYVRNGGKRQIIPMEYHAQGGLTTGRVLEENARAIDLIDVRRRILDSSDLFCFLPDRAMQAQVELVPFLGALAFIDTVPFRLAVMCGCPLLIVTSVKTGPSSYKVISGRLDPFLQSSPSEEVLSSLINAYAKFLEQVIVRYPESWFNFYHYFSKLPGNPKGPIWPRIHGKVSYLKASGKNREASLCIQESTPLQKQI